MWQNLKDYFSKPFSEDMDTLHWFLFFGLLICISIMWKLILRHIHVGV